MAQLARMGSAEQQAACRARLDDLEPPIRYCAYQLDKAGGAAGTRGPEPSSPATTRLQVRGREVADDGRVADVPAAGRQRQRVIHHVHSWTCWTPVGLLCAGMATQQTAKRLGYAAGEDGCIA